jgi:hypothetical protein
VSVDLSLALIPFLKTSVAAGAREVPNSCPSDLLAWLGRCNGLLLDDGTWFLGWGQHLDARFRIEAVFESYPVFARNNWWPVASDGCGNYWVLTADGVGFVDCAEDPGRVAYVVASSLERFLVPFLLPFVDRNGWPFDRATVQAWDASVLSVNLIKAWEA